MVGGVGRLAGGWLGALVPVVSFVGECFRACWRLSCYFIWYSMYVFLSVILPTCSGEVRVRTNASVCYCTAVAWWVGWLVGRWLGGWVGGWVGVSCGAWVFCRQNGSRCRVGAVVVFGPWDWDFHTVQGGVDPEDIDFRLRGVGVVEVWKDA